ncbi:MAG: UvrD-helicase domain-containing protein, partial [Clostridia bacterium]|nr:UvrD-helicase domain-containing protein [Clostridia bacterium]
MQNLLDLRNKVIEKEFGSMNDRQFEAVTTTEGPLLVLAGAGSGKTTVLVNRIACLCKYGNAYGSWDEPFLNVNHIEEIRQYLEGERDSIDIPELASHPARPWEILAITFTNKAAGELKERIALKLGDTAGEVAAGTFHSICGKILRRNADKIGFTSHFTIYDTDDQKMQMKEIMKAEEIDESFLPIKLVL